MQLLIDLGNTRLKWALASAGRIDARGAFAHTGAAIAGAIEREWATLPAIERIHVASVAPLALDVDIETYARRRWNVVPEFLRSPAAALGIRNAYAEPERLGIDRFLGLAAVHAAAARAQVLVGVGTAMTLDALGADGAHLGGWIAPSPALMRDAVLARTARVGVWDGHLVDFADNTADALQSGTLRAASGAIAGFMANAAQRFDARPAIVLTGGGAADLAPLVPDARLREDLVLEGLALWAAAAAASEFRGTDR